MRVVKRSERGQEEQEVTREEESEGEVKRGHNETAIKWRTCFEPECDGGGHLPGRLNLMPPVHGNVQDLHQKTNKATR